MPRVHHVKKARKDNPVAKKGESYYWWQLYRSPKQFSKTAPKRSQLTNSSYLSQLYDLVDGVENRITSFDDLESVIEELSAEIEALGEECQDSLDNMPEQLQYAPTGELLQERISACEESVSQLDSIDIPEYDEDDDPEQTEDEWKAEKLEEIKAEIIEAMPEEM